MLRAVKIATEEINNMKNLLVYNYSYTADSFMKSVELYAEANNCYPVSNDKVLPLISQSGNPELVVFLDKDIYLANYIESLGIRVINNSKTIEIFDDKFKTYLAVKEYIQQPDTYSYPFTFNNTSPDAKYYSFIADNLGFPLVVKENHGSLGEQIYLVKNLKEMIDCSNKLRRIPHLFQRYIKTSEGMDLRFFIFGKKCRGAIKRINDKDFRSNVNLGGKLEVLNPNLYEKEKKVAEIIAEKFDLNFGSVDFFSNTEEPLLCEINTSPMIYNYFKLTGINLAEYITEQK